MAIDTQNKRRSVLRVLPVPDGSIDAQDRPHVLWIYAGITIALPAVVTRVELVPPTINWVKPKGALLASRSGVVVATYTMDAAYITTYTINPSKESKYLEKRLPRGTVLAIDPSSQKVVPNFTPYGFSVLGVLYETSEHGDYENSGDNYDREVGVILHGTLYEKACWDSGTKGTVLGATKDALSKRIDFVKKTGKTRWK